MQSKSLASVFLFLLVFVPLSLPGQNPANETLRMTVNQYYQTSIDSTIVSASEFVLYGTSRIEWIQDGGTVVDTFQILEVDGDWSDINAFGENVYRVSSLGVEGQIAITKSSDGLFIKMEFLSGGENLMPFHFNVTAVLPE